MCTPLWDGHIHKFSWQNNTRCQAASQTKIWNKQGQQRWSCLSVCPSSVIHHYRCYSVATVRRYIHASKTYFQIQSEKKKITQWWSTPVLLTLHPFQLYTHAGLFSLPPTLHLCCWCFTQHTLHHVSSTWPSPALYLFCSPPRTLDIFYHLTLTQAFSAQGVGGGLTELPTKSIVKNGK